MRHTRSAGFDGQALVVNFLVLFVQIIYYFTTNRNINQDDYKTGQLGILSGQGNDQGEPEVMFILKGVLVIGPTGKVGQVVITGKMKSKNGPFK